MRQASLLAVVHFPSFPKSVPGDRDKLAIILLGYIWDGMDLEEPTARNNSKGHFSYLSLWGSFMDPGDLVF